MASQSPVTHRILKAVRHTHGCDLDSLASSLPDLTWNQVFLEVDRLSRLGRIRVTAGSSGTYLIRLPDRRKRVESPGTRP
jgi:hypothetical protein